jgi:hypothetical protein
LTAIADLPVEWLAATYAPEGRGAGHAIRWKRKYGGLMPSEARKLRHLEEENGRLRKLVADLTLDKEMPREVVRRNL